MKKILMALMAMAVVAPVFAQEEPPPIVEASHNAVVAFLNLSPEQVEAWDVIYQIHRDHEKPLQEAMAAVQEEIDALFDAGDPDSAEVGALFIERRDLSGQLLEVHLVYHEALVALLDGGQARKLRFMARADDVQKFIPAFKLFELIPRR